MTAPLLRIPALSLVFLIGPSGSGKSTLAKRLFHPSEVLSSDAFRGMVRNDENDMSATADAFAALHFILEKRLAAGLLTVIDATNVKDFDRASLLAVARKYHVIPVAIVLDVSIEICLQHNAQRPDRAGSRAWVIGQHGALRRSLRGGTKALEKEGFRYVYVLDNEARIAGAQLERTKVYSDAREERGPFDIIGDVHGCYDELCMLLERLGYVEDAEGVPRHKTRRAIFLGDLVDRGPRSLDSLLLAKRMVDAGAALMVPGNHEVKLERYLRGKNVKPTHGLARTIAELDALTPEEKGKTSALLSDFIQSLISHLVLEDGKLVVAHAGMKKELQMRGSGAVREFALYGETTGEVDADGFPVRADWALDYAGDAEVVYGHTPVHEAVWVNRTICIDTGCVFGGVLTALRWPEHELVQVPAKQAYWEGRVRKEAHVTAALHENRSILELGELTGKRTFTTKLMPSITIEGAQAAEAVELLSRFAVNPRWLIHLPPTMSPVETSTEGSFLEHPAQAFAYFEKVLPTPIVICEEKHMGSRAIVIVCRDASVAEKRFGIAKAHHGHGLGIVYTRTGRRFFDDAAIEEGLLDTVRKSAESAGLFERFQTDWLCLDAELMPWSLKAQELIRNQYARTANASRGMLEVLTPMIEQARARGLRVSELKARTEQRVENTARFQKTMEGYVWPTPKLEDMRLAVFHLLAHEGHVRLEESHSFHLEVADALAAHDPSGMLIRTGREVVDLRNPKDVERATAWWLRMTEAGGEGMVVKPLEGIVKGSKGPLQPALKVRGRDYLRLIYGIDYDMPSNLSRLRQRGVQRKRSLAVRELALGHESLLRFVRKDSLTRMHECVLGVLALESEAVDPRL
jgi:protein phosphatase